MKWAWVENDQIRDYCEGDPTLLYHPDVAVFYNTPIADEVDRGWRLVDGEWTAPPQPDPPVYVDPGPPVEQPMTADQAQAELNRLDAQFDPRWFEDLVAGSPMHDRYVAWSSRREELREIIRNG